MPEMRTPEELAAELDAQLHLLRKACAEYDAGDLHEFRNIARALRLILAKDDFGNASLWCLAGHAETPIRDSRPAVHPLNIAPFFGLAAIVIGSDTIGCRPLLDAASGKSNAPAQEWLEQVIIDDKAGGIFTRHRLIKAVANLGGATHFPPDVRAYFSNLQEMGVKAIRAGQPIEVNYRDIEKHSLRQIAHEVICAYDSNYRRTPPFVGGSLVVCGFEMVLVPGRQVEMGAIVKKTPAPVIFAPQANGIEGITGPEVKLPYEGVAKNAPCICHSGLRFKNCCQRPGKVSADFVEEFRQRHRLGKYRAGTAS